MEKDEDGRYVVELSETGFSSRALWLLPRRMQSRLPVLLERRRTAAHVVPVRHYVHRTCGAAFGRGFPSFPAAPVRDHSQNLLLLAVLPAALQRHAQAVRL